MVAADNQYDFILSNPAKPARRPLRPSLSNPLALIGLLLIVIVVIAVLGAVFGAKHNKVGGLAEVIGRAQEINRVSTAQAQVLTDPATIAVDATSQSALASDQAQLKKYASDHKIDIDKQKVDSLTDKSTDSRLAQAAANNSLDAAYDSYLKSALTDYQTSLSKAYSATSDGGLRAVLKASYDSAAVLLTAPVLKSTN